MLKHSRTLPKTAQNIFNTKQNATAMTHILMILHTRTIHYLWFMKNMCQTLHTNTPKTNFHFVKNKLSLWVKRVYIGNQIWQNPEPQKPATDGFWGRIWPYGRIQRMENVPMDIIRFQKIKHMFWNCQRSRPIYIYIYMGEQNPCPFRLV